MLNPNLTSLRLDFCGRMNDSVLETWSSCLPALRHIDLHGPYLVHSAAWVAFFEARPKLETFRIFQSTRFDLACVQALVQHCDNLQDLRLKEVGQLSDALLTEIERLNHLIVSDLADPANSCSEDALSAMLANLGMGLRQLDLSGHLDLTDTFLTTTLVQCCGNLTSLALNNTPELTDAGLAAMFNAWRDDGQGSALSSLSFSRNSELGDDALQALLAASGRSLEHLDINGWMHTKSDTLAAIGVRARELRTLDVGFNREVTDVVVGKILKGCERLKEVRVWGCNRVTINCPRKVRSLFSVVMLIC